jgi:hypothetical protein
LRQIVDAPPDEKENLLKDLEAFAFRGIPELCDGKIKGMMTPSVSPVSSQTSRQQSKQLSVSSAGSAVPVSYSTC